MVSKFWMMSRAAMPIGPVRMASSRSQLSRIQLNTAAMASLMVSKFLTISSDHRADRAR